MPRLANSLVIAVALLLGSALAPPPAEADQKREKIERLLEISGTAKATRQLVAALSPRFLEMMRQAFPGAPPAVMEAFEAEVMVELATTTPALIDELATLYARNFTESDVDAMLRFWRSTTGRKLAEMSPRITLEGLEVAQDWGHRAAVRAIQRLQDQAQQGTL